MSPEKLDFYPDWDFLNDPRLRELQQSLDASLSDYSGVEDLRNKCAAFRVALLEYFE